MQGSSRYSSSGSRVYRALLALTLLTLLTGCGDSLPEAATPTLIAPTPQIAPTGAESTLTAAEPSPTASPSTAAITSTSSSSVSSPLARPASWSPTIHWRGGDWYLLGADYPYHQYGNDFGGNSWGSYGVHDPKTNAAVDADFARMASLGMNSARWFVFADGRAGITYNAAGMPAGLDEFVFKDMDAALEIARRHNINLNLVLLDYRFLWNARVDHGVQLGGHAAILQSPAGQDALLQNVFEPMFRRYAGNPSILSWEVMNEPEWTLEDAGTVNRKEVSQPLTLATFRTFAQLTVDAIHAEARTYATIGCADAKWAQNWTDLGLDYYQVHYYDWMKPFSTDNLYAMRAESLQLNRPVVVGEYPADHSTVAGLRDYLETWKTNGFAGAWAWSFRGDTTWGSPDPQTIRAWADAHRTSLAIPAAP